MLIWDKGETMATRNNSERRITAGLTPPQFCMMLSCSRLYHTPTVGQHGHDVIAQPAAPRAYVIRSQNTWRNWYVYW